MTGRVEGGLSHTLNNQQDIRSLPGLAWPCTVVCLTGSVIYDLSSHDGEPVKPGLKIEIIVISRAKGRHECNVGFLSRGRGWRL